VNLTPNEGGDAVSVPEDIVLGKHDDELDTIDRAVQERRSILGRALAVSLTRNAHVRIKDVDSIV
jgi:hypothetical protein